MASLDIGSVASAVVGGGVILGLGYLAKHSIRHKGLPPGPTRVPILGNLAFLPQDAASFNSQFQKMCQDYGPMYCFYLGNVPIVVISDYSMLKEAFVTKGIELAGRPDSYMTLYYNPDYPHKKGIIDASYSEEWKRQRNTALSILRTLGWGRSVIEHRIQEESNFLLQELDNFSGKSVDPSHLISTCVANIICSLLFGERFHHQDPEFQELLKAIEDMLEAFVEEGASQYLFFVKYTSKNKMVVKKLAENGGCLVKFYRRQIEKAKLRRQKQKEDNDFVSLYLKELDSVGADSRIQEDWLIQHTSDFFIAGAETTATTLRWAMLYMANNQEVQEKCHKEIANVCGTGHTMSLKDRDRLPYTEATVMEIQRLASLLPLGLPHLAMRDTELLGYKLPAGCEVWGNLYGILRNPEKFPEPEKMKPQRFLNEKQDSSIRIDDWIPFSMGRRTCLGEQLARQELFLFFTNILQSYKILPPEGVHTIDFHEVFKFVLKPSYYEVRFVKR